MGLVLNTKSKNSVMNYVYCLINALHVCCPLESGEMGGGRSGVHSEGRESQPRLETLDRRRQTLFGGLIDSMNDLNQNTDQ